MYHFFFFFAVSDWFDWKCAIVESKRKKKMKSVICFAVLIGAVIAYPAQDGAAYTNEAIRQAQSSHLIPQNAQIQNVRNFRYTLFLFIVVCLFVCAWH